MKQAVRNGYALCDQLGLPHRFASAAAEQDFPVFAPLEYIRRMQPGNPQDPLLLQVLGMQREMEDQGSGLLDPVGDEAAQRAEGVLQKYKRRVLLITTGACAIHCRYCFRRHYPYETAPKGKAGFSRSLELIRQDAELDEVILSGGDPLTLADETLGWLVDELCQIPHVRRIRLHTRLPVVIPQRVCETLLDWVRRSSAAMYFVLHFNHAQEIDAAVSAALADLHRSGAVLLNQSVLLRGVNDSLEAQRDLCLALVDRRVVPYYLHQLDLVQGALHFAVEDAAAQALVASLRSELPGYAVPTLVREIAGQASKTPL
ncbi:EF-P beta-lysylation protein EpmB [Aureliella helgolandensis]|nr:EF-P beta-lysylation protein EpmB [Aureliella helgolandensis]